MTTRQSTSDKRTEKRQERAKKKTLWPYFMVAVHLSQGYRTPRGDILPFLQRPQEFLVLI